MTIPQEGGYALPWGERLGLLVATVNWGVLRGALRDLGIAAELREPVTDLGTWDRQRRGLHVLAGDLDGRAYVYDPSGEIGSLPDPATELAARTDAFVLTHSYDDTSGRTATTTPADAQLRRHQRHHRGHGGAGPDGAAPALGRGRPQ